MGDDRVLHVLGDVDQDRAGPSRAGHVERLLDDPGDLAGVLDQVMMLGDRARDLHHRGLLERVGADDVARHLAGDRHQRDGIHLGVGQAGHQVQRTRAGGRHHHARPARGPRISFGGEDAPLLVSRQDRANPVAKSRQGLMERHARAARISEDDLDPMANERLDQDVGPGHRLGSNPGRRLTIIDDGHGSSSLARPTCGSLAGFSSSRRRSGNCTTIVQPATMRRDTVSRTRVRRRPSDWTSGLTVRAHPCQELYEMAMPLSPGPPQDWGANWSVNSSATAA